MFYQLMKTAIQNRTQNSVHKKPQQGVNGDNEYVERNAAYDLLRTTTATDNRSIRCKMSVRPDRSLTEILLTKQLPLTCGHKHIY